MVVNLFFASTMDVTIGEKLGHNGWLYSILIGTALVLVFGEMTPKNLIVNCDRHVSILQDVQIS